MLSFETVLFSAGAILVILFTLLRLPTPPVGVQVAVLGILVAVLGIPHGALDPLIARRAGIWTSVRGFALFNLGYVALVGLVVAVWLVAPTASLVVFLVVSGIHFGADWNTRRSIPLRALTGLGLLTLPAFAHHDDVSTIYGTLAGNGGMSVAAAQTWLGPFAVAAMLVGAIVALRRRPADALEITLAAALALIAPPLVFFAVYFCALHSARHLRTGFAAERGAGRLTIAITVVYTVVPVAASVILFLLFSSAPAGGLAAPSDVILRLVFIGLAALTVPHMVLVDIAERERPLRSSVS
jgi:Brp/Blh family beta-carotene 15,15'-monooxygenase